MIQILNQFARAYSIVGGIIMVNIVTGLCDVCQGGGLLKSVLENFLFELNLDFLADKKVFQYFKSSFRSNEFAKFLEAVDL